MGQNQAGVQDSVRTVIHRDDEKGRISHRLMEHCPGIAVGHKWGVRVHVDHQPIVHHGIVRWLDVR